MAGEIREVRDYFKDTVTRVDSDMKESPSIFTDEAMADQLLDTEYILRLGDIFSDILDNTVEDKMKVEIVFKRLAYNDPKENFLKGYELASCIRHEALTSAFRLAGDKIKDVECETIQVEPLENNENSSKFTLEFEVTLHYVRN